MIRYSVTYADGELTYFVSEFPEEQAKVDERNEPHLKDIERYNLACQKGKAGPVKVKTRRMR